LTETQKNFYRHILSTTDSQKFSRIANHTLNIPPSPTSPMEKKNVPLCFLSPAKYDKGLEGFIFRTNLT